MGLTEEARNLLKKHVPTVVVAVVFSALQRTFVAIALASFVPFWANTYVYAISEGPSQPEAMQFEPVDTTDLVNLATGDFTYSLPLLSIPGPAGDYPLNLSYHAGIGTNQDATWVGLGWTLNPGAINRTISGYPDDYTKVRVQNHFQAPQKEGTIISVGLGYGPAGLNVKYDSYVGNFGVNASYTLGISGLAGVALSGGTAGVDATAHLGIPISSDLNLGLAIGTQGVSLSGHLAVPYVSSVGFSLSSSGANANFSFAGLGIRGVTESGSGTFTSSSFGLIIPSPWGLTINLSASQWKWVLDETYDELSFGYANATDYLNDVSSNKHFERVKHGAALFPSQDFYVANAQGLHGTFMPFTTRSYTLRDDWQSTGKGQLRERFNRNYETVFKFLDDAGANHITDDGTGSRWGHNYEPLFIHRHGSRIIRPIWSDPSHASGNILGFIIIATDGKTYEFKQQVRNHFQFSYQTNDYPIHSEGSALVDPDYSSMTERDLFYNYNVLPAPYATNWLLSAIKGPDYVDRNDNGTCDEDDWGYWVKLSYRVSDKPQVWRTPFRHFAPSATSDAVVNLPGHFDRYTSSQHNPANVTVGARDVVYLERVETASHLADFVTSDAKDHFTPSLALDRLRVKGRAINYTDSESDFTLKLAFAFPGKFAEFISGADDQTDVVLLRNIRNGRTFHLRKHELGILDKGDQTYLRGDRSLRTTIPNLLADYEVTLLFDSVLQNRAGGWKYTKAKRLDRIDLYSKADPNVRKVSNRWEILSTLTSPLRSINFGYDHSLCPGTPGSEATVADGAERGKLTLKSLEILGKDRAAGGIPPYQFVYARGDRPGRGLNPEYRDYNWDNWGSYRSSYTPNSLGIHNHETPQEKASADLAAAWSLTTIITPTGGRINVEYESDDYFFVNDYYDEAKADFSFDSPEFQNNRLRLAYVPAGTLKAAALHGGNALHLNVSPNQTEFTPGQFVVILERQTYRLQDGTVSVHWNQMRRQIAYARREVGLAGQEVTHLEVDGLRGVSFSPVADPRGNRDYFVYVKREFYGGGIRVKSLESSDLISKYKTIYGYKDEYGLSSGVTATLPAKYNEARVNFYGDLEDAPLLLRKSRGTERYWNLFAESDYNHGRPSPSIIYSRVEVTNVNFAGQSINGKTVYTFHTARDYPYRPSFSGDSESGTMDGNLLSIVDESAYYGKPKDIKQYELTPSRELRTVKVDTFNYTLSRTLHSLNRLFDNRGITLNSRNKPPGLTQEKYRYENEVGETARTSRTRVGKVERIYENVFMTSSTSRLIYYDAPTDLDTSPRGVLSTNTINLYRDALSGQVIASATRSSDDKAVVTTQTPAYWIYGPMQSKNLLTQTAQNTVYKISESYSSFLNRVLSIDYSLPPEDILFSTATTWIDSNHDVEDETDGSDSVWRVSRTYQYNKKLDRAGGSPFTPYNTWWPRLLQHPVNPDSPWKLTSFVTFYNTNSHPIEEFREDGTYISSIYGHKDALPIALVKNARLPQVRYFGFEDLSILTPAQRAQVVATGGKTGQRLAKARNGDRGHVYSFTMQGGLEYRVSFWAKTGTAQQSSAPRLSFRGDTLTLGQGDISSQMRSTDQWQYIEGTITPLRYGVVAMYILSGPDIVPGLEDIRDPGAYHYVDDIRIYPADAVMRTFTYDPLSLQVTSTTDENNVSTYYDYDEWDRLVRIRDQDRNILNNFVYRYGPERRQRLNYVPGNYIKKQSILAPIVDAARITSLADAEKRESIDYFTALGKLRQSILIKATPSKGDLVTPVLYDELGNLSVAHLPYAARPGTGLYRPDAFNDQLDFFRNEARVAHSDYPSARTIRENSPLLRIKEQGAYGEAWQPAANTRSGGHTVKTRYRTNSEGEVRLWKFPDITGNVYSDSFYNPNEVNVTETEDEQGHVTTEYRSKANLVILRKASNTAVHAYMPSRDEYLLKEVDVATYYVHDEFGNLRFVIPPMAVAEMKQTNSWAINNAIKDKWATELIYDGYHRVVEKRIAGASPLYTVYDRLDRPVLFQDGKLRQMNRWLFTKYDILGREILTGIYHDDRRVTRVAMQELVDDFVVNATTAFYETRVNVGGNSLLMNLDHAQGYSNRAFPYFSGASTVRTVTFYDDYDFNSNGQTNDDYRFIPDAEFANNQPFYRLKNRVTGRRTKVLAEGGGSSQWLTTVYFYDNRGRVIQTISRTLQGISDTNAQYDFAGKILKTKTLHNTADPLMIRKRYEYDDAARVVKIYQQNNVDREVLVAENRYNELGQISEKNLHSEDHGATFLQSVDYSRNIRGWITHINNRDLKRDSVFNNDTNDLFGMELGYDADSPSLSVLPQYTGNVSLNRWRTASDRQERSYAYFYDRFGQLTRANYSSFANGSWDSENRYSLRHAAYDLNGNLRQLRVNGPTSYSTDHPPKDFRLLDDLEYFYHGNRLIGVNDSVPDIVNNGNADFSDRAHDGVPRAFDTATHEYLYDANGNMIEDKNKGITIAYNYLNLPTRVDFGSGNRIEWLYSAAGEKLRKTVFADGNVTKSSEFADQVIYENDVVRQFAMDQGQVVKLRDGALRYQYNLLDHLGNVRVTFTKGENNLPQVIEETHYYPFGSKISGLGRVGSGTWNVFAFNGKELEGDHGLNWYHYGARFYDPQLGRWHVMDPVDESHSPYAYVKNNPSNAIDPDGQDATIVNNRCLSLTPSEFAHLKEPLSPYYIYGPRFPTFSREAQSTIESMLNHFSLGWQERAPKVAAHLRNNPILVGIVEFQKEGIRIQGERSGPHAIWLGTNKWNILARFGPTFLHELVHDMKNKYGLQYGEFEAYAAEAYVYGGSELVESLIYNSLNYESSRNYWLKSIPAEFSNYFDEEKKLIPAERERFIKEYLRHGKDIVGSTAVDDEEFP